MSCTTSRGVKCSPASSLFSSLKRRMSSSKTVPMPWLSRPSSRTEPSPFVTGLGLRLTELSRNFSIRKPSASASTKVGIWLRNLNFSRTSWTFGEKPSRYASKSARSCCCPPSGGKIAEPEGRGVVEGLAGGLAQRPVLVRYAGGVQLRLHAAHRVLRRFQDCIKAANDGHGQNDVAVLAPHVDIAKHVVRYPPYEAADVQGVHWLPPAKEVRPSVCRRNAAGHPRPTRAASTGALAADRRLMQTFPGCSGGRHPSRAGVGLR